MDRTQVTFTPTERRLLRILSDGDHHTNVELLMALEDELATQKNLRDHLQRLRKKLKPRGELILNTVRFRRTYYQHVRRLVVD